MAAARDAILKNYGFECQGQRLPLNWNNVLQLQGKLAYSYGSGSNVSVTGLGTGNQFRRYPGDLRANSSAQNSASNFIGNPGAYRGQHRWSRLAVLNWNHSVFKTSDRQLALNVNLSWGQDNRIEAPLDPAFEASTRSPTMGIELKTMQFAGVNANGFPFPITDEIIKNIRTNQGLRTPLLARTDLNNSAPFRTNPYGLSSTAGWYTSGLEAIDAGTTSTEYQENRYRAFGQVDWQANRFHRFNFGGEYKKANLSFWNADLVSEFGMVAYIGHPYTYALWGADRLDLGDVVLELGVRWDNLNTGALFPNAPGHISTNTARVCANGASSCPSADSTPNWSPIAGSNAASYDSSVARVFTAGENHHTLSPRLRVSFPITERTDFRLSYAQQVNTPEFNTLLSGTNNDFSYTNTNDFFGSDVTFGKTILVEFGVRHAFSPDLVLDVAAYNKDFVSDLAYRVQKFPDPSNPGAIQDINVLTNSDFGYARGLDLTFNWRAGNWLNAAVAYTFQVARNTGSDPFSYLQTSGRSFYSALNVQVPPPEQALPTNDNRAHNFVGSVAVNVPSDWQRGTALGTALRDVGVFVTFRSISGLRYTVDPAPARRGHFDWLHEGTWVRATFDRKTRVIYSMDWIPAPATTTS